VSTNEGPLSKLLRGLGVDADLAPIEAVKRIEVMPVKLRNMVYDRIPVGHDLGYRCYDGDKHDPDSAYQSGEYGDGLTEDQAYADWLQNVDEVKPRAGRVIHSSPFEPPTVIDDRDVDFDSDLEDDAR
jgi:hypothetical protein